MFAIGAGARRSRMSRRLLSRGVLVVLGTAALGLSAGAMLARGQQGSASSSDKPATVYTREIVLDKDLGASLHLNFLISEPMVLAQSKVGCRVASVMGFTTVNDRIQFDLAHVSPAVPMSGVSPIDFIIGVDDAGASADFNVTLTPHAPRTWGTVKDVSDLEVNAKRL